ncbi:MAG: nicotinate (nicotinamide) nucleotide adenylyltransferase [Flavobacteriales bacterium]
MGKRTGLYFGTFNPIHVGHLVIANYMVEFTELEEVWLVVSPQNPLKKKNSLLEDYHRLTLVREAVEDNDSLQVSDVEFHLSKPSYTVNTLAYLKEKYPNRDFALIMGEDNLRTLHKWKNHERILENHKVYVYPRALTEQELTEEAESELSGKQAFHDHSNVVLCDAPVMRVSASFIRQAIKDGKDVRYLLTEPVYRYINEMHFYR